MNHVSVPIVRRRVRIPFETAQPVGWHHRSKTSEEFLNAISFFLPPGERFFIRSLQNYQDRITDPALKDEMKRFIYQEAMHTKEHNRCNEALEKAFPDGKRIEKLADAVLSWHVRWAPKAWQLAITCALEHFTAMLADDILTNQDYFISVSDPAFADLWLWHAVEETEHKGVCFDVYREAVGKGPFAYFTRTLCMVLTTLVLVSVVYFSVRQIKKKAPPVQKAGEPLLRDGLWTMLKSSISFPMYMDYFRYSFHPWDHDNSKLVANWKARHRDFGGSPDQMADVAPA